MQKDNNYKVDSDVKVEVVSDIDKKQQKKLNARNILENRRYTSSE